MDIVDEPTQYKIQCSNDEEITIDDTLVNHSAVLQGMVEDTDVSDQQSIPLPEIMYPRVVQLLVEYIRGTTNPDQGTKEVETWKRAFIDRITGRIDQDGNVLVDEDTIVPVENLKDLVELVLAADYLELPKDMQSFFRSSLLEPVRDMTPDEQAVYWGIDLKWDDLSKEEQEEALRIADQYTGRQDSE